MRIISALENITVKLSQVVTALEKQNEILEARTDALAVMGPAAEIFAAYIKKEYGTDQETDKNLDQGADHAEEKK